MKPQIDSLNQEPNPKGYETPTAWKTADGTCPIIIITFGAYIEKRVNQQTIHLLGG